MNRDPRQTALDILLYWHKNCLTIDSAFEKFSKRFDTLAAKDKNLCNALVFGVLRHRETIDWIIKTFSKNPLDKTDTRILYIIRMALFQVIYMDRIPVFAALNTAVEMAKKIDRKKAGFVNAVLRKASTDYNNIVYPDQSRDPALYAAVKYSLPLWLSKKWTETYGFETAAGLVKNINTIPFITIRANSLKISRQDLFQKIEGKVENLVKTGYSPHGLNFKRPEKPLHEFDEFTDGLFQVQDEAAQIVSDILSPKPGETILDACAGPGGKTGHIAQLMNNQGKITAIDVDPSQTKLKSLELQMKRLGINIVETRSCDILKADRNDFPAYFDRVLLDAPCTGLGVLRRNPDTKWKRNQNDILRLGARQKKMLNAAANLVKPGGVLLFSVCSCEKEENEDVIKKFLEKRKDFSIDQNCIADGLKPFFTKHGFFKTYPHINNMDGFFAARLIRHPGKNN